MEMENLEVYLDSSQVIFGPFASFVVRRQTLCTTMRIPLLVETLSSPSCSTYKSVTKKSLPQFCKIFQSISLQPSIDLNNQTQFSGLLLVSLAIITLFSSVTYLFLG